MVWIVFKIEIVKVIAIVWIGNKMNEIINEKEKWFKFKKKIIMYEKEAD